MNDLAMTPGDQQRAPADAPPRETPSAAGVMDAAKRLAGVVMRTPMLESPVLNDRIGGRALLKPEVLQHCGSFKFRGAYNRLSRLSEAEKARGVVAWSSGNHAQGVALAAKRLGVQATIIMPKDAPALKIERVKALGGEIILYDRYTEDREAIGRALAGERNSVLVPSYDDRYIIEGQGTAALELAEDAARAGVALDALLVCCGGGGLTAGCALALSAISPQTEIIAVEPAGFDDTARSLAAGKRVSNNPSARSICDAILTPTPGELTFDVMRKLRVGSAAVTDEQVLDAMAFAFKHLKLVVEPGGAVALTALLSGAYDASGKTVGVLLSGGNVEPAMFARALERI
ncbi:MAG: threonine/serine dehydratase [Parvularculaceae bacterium]